MTDNIIKFTEGDLRVKIFIETIENVIYERCAGLSLATVLGALEVIKTQMIDRNRSE